MTHDKSVEKNNIIYDEIATAFVQTYFGNPIIRRPFYMNYIGKTKLGEMLSNEIRGENIQFLDKKDFPSYPDKFRKEILKIGLLSGIQFILFRSDDQKLFLDIVPARKQ